MTCHGLRVFHSGRIIGQVSVRGDWLSTQAWCPWTLTSITVDCDITQMVDIRKGVHCMVPKSILVKK